MNWRWAVPALLGFLLVELIMGFGAYNSATWDIGRDKVLYRWDAVREVCLIFVPAFVGVVGLLVWLIVMALNWADRGRK